jgi:lactoylglutathione lyase
MAMRLHVAIRCTIEEVLAAPMRLRSAGITPLGFGGEPVDEPIVIGWMPAASVFFTDPDGHSLEYLAMLPDEPRSDAGVVPYSVWQAQQN